MNFLTLTLAAAEGGGPDPVGHIIAHPFLTWNGWWVWSSAIGNMVLAGLIMLVLGPYVARRIGTGPESAGDERYLTKNRFVEIIEVITFGIRDGILDPLLGKRTAVFAPFLLCLFYFILINNLLGLIPIADILMLGQYYLVKLTASGTPEQIQQALSGTWKMEHRVPLGGTATQSIWVTGGLALLAFLLINGAGIRQIGVVNYLKHLTAGTPWPLWFIMVPVEILGVFIKPIALALRLFANMTAGHILMAVLFLFIEMGWGLIDKTQNTLVGVAGFTVIGVLAGAGAIGIFLLEIFVAFLQAFIFMFLTAVFTSLYEHHGEHEHDDAGVHGAYDELEHEFHPAAA
ncbi:MAG: F0F1 ATP synthase subunit A [Phycisphaerales bacterium JB039]